jgi:hypothetical protein
MASDFIVKDVIHKITAKFIHAFLPEAESPTTCAPCISRNWTFTGSRINDAADAPLACAAGLLAYAPPAYRRVRRRLIGGCAAGLPAGAPQAYWRMRRRLTGGCAAGLPAGAPERISMENCPYGLFIKF